MIKGIQTSPRSHYEVYKGRAYQWEVWHCIGGEKQEVEKIFDWKYQAESLARKLNTELWLERSNSDLAKM